MFLPIAQSLPLRDLVDLLDQCHGGVGVKLVFQHLTDEARGLFGKRPGFCAPRVTPGAGVGYVEHIADAHSARTGGQKGNAF
ncbi:MAG: hypothetical protein K5746_03950 [Clostridiales bacterium]|nr:hypothetical protein [Clostridiales bacterium]